MYLSYSESLDHCYAGERYATWPRAVAQAAKTLCRGHIVELLSRLADLTGRSRFKDLLVRARRLSERQFLAGDGTQGAVFKAGKEPGVDVRFFSRCNSPQREPANRGDKKLRTFTIS